MRLSVRVLGLSLIDVDWTTEEDPGAYGDTGTPLTIGFRPPEPDPDRPDWYEED